MEKTGAQALVQTFAECGVTHCFANPGTSEMHLIQALDKEPRIKSVLCLFEGIASAAADGFARISGTPAITLLHLGPGYANAMANIHNARKGFVPMINVIGEHATYHRHFDAPLTSNIENIVKENSTWIGVVETPQNAGEMAANAFAAANLQPNSPVSLILPADSGWSKGGVVANPPAPAKASKVSGSKIDQVSQAIKAAKKPLILIGGDALYDDDTIEIMGRLNALGIRIMINTFPTRQSRGAGRFAPEKMQYFAEMALKAMEDIDLMVLAGTTSPCSFFAYPNTPSSMVPENCATIILSERSENTKQALQDLASNLNANSQAAKIAREELPKPNGKLTTQSIAQTMSRHMPENSIVCDDGVSSGFATYFGTKGANKHDWLSLTGGAIGQGLALAIGAQMAAPENKTIALSGDGAAMYNIQALWTMAREKLPIVTIIFGNRNYNVLNVEMARTGAGQVGETAKSMLSLQNPDIDFVVLANGQGVKAKQAKSAEEFDEIFENALKANEPFLIEAII